MAVPFGPTDHIKVYTASTARIRRVSALPQQCIGSRLGRAIDAAESGSQSGIITETAQ